MEQLVVPSNGKIIFAAFVAPIPLLLFYNMVLMAIAFYKVESSAPPDMSLLDYIGGFWIVFSVSARIFFVGFSIPLYLFSLIVLMHFLNYKKQKKHRLIDYLKCMAADILLYCALISAIKGILDENIISTFLKSLLVMTPLAEFVGLQLTAIMWLIGYGIKRNKIEVTQNDQPR